MKIFASFTLILFVFMVCVMVQSEKKQDEEDVKNITNKGWYPILNRGFRKTTRIKRFVDIEEMWKNAFDNARTLITRIIPSPLRRVLPFARDEVPDATAIKNQNLQNPGANRREHGNLDFFGRDLARSIGKAVEKVEKTLGFLSSNVSRGLDSNKTFFSGVAQKFKEQVRAIYPGTLWCGDGDIARSFNDLGPFHLTDRCCRQHDNCQDSIGAGKTENGLENSGLFTRSSCQCDTAFYNCLKDANTLVAKKIGFTYFTVLGPQCFSEDFPIISCTQLVKGRCLSYERDIEKSKNYQWFDNPTF